MSFPSLHASVGFTYACNLPRLVAKSPAAPAPASGATSKTARTSARMSAALTFTTPPRRRWDTGTLGRQAGGVNWVRSEEHTSELQSRLHLVCRLLLEKKK